MAGGALDCRDQPTHRRDEEFGLRQGAPARSAEAKDAPKLLPATGRWGCSCGFSHRPHTAGSRGIRRRAGRDHGSATARANAGAGGSAGRQADVPVDRRICRAGRADDLLRPARSVRPVMVPGASPASLRPRQPPAGAGMTDLMLLPESALRAQRPPRVRGHAAMPGSGPPGETCRSCEHYTRVQHAKAYLKCGLRRANWTGGAGTDIRASDPACSKWQKPA